MNPKDIARMITEDPDVVVEAAPKYTKQQVGRAIGLIKGGMNVSQAARETNMNPSSLYIKLKRSGEIEKIKAEVGSLMGGKRHPSYKEINDQQIFDLIRSGMNVLQVSKATGISRDIIYNRIQNAPEPIKTELEELLSRALTRHYKEKSEVMKSGQAAAMQAVHPTKDFWNWLISKPEQKRIEIIYAMFGDNPTASQKKKRFDMIQKAKAL